MPSLKYKFSAPPFKKQQNRPSHFIGREHFYEGLIVAVWDSQLSPLITHYTHITHSVRSSKHFPVIPVK